MLKSLKISNFAIIENAELEFENHLTVITGETGSGKSILLGALNLLLGERADFSVIRDPNAKTIVEGTWEISPEHQSFFEQNDLDFDAICIIRREILKEGKSRAFINDTPINLNLLKEFTRKLVHIHSQHNTLELRDKNFQLSVLDLLGNHQTELNHYRESFRTYTEQKKDFEKLEQQLSALKQEQDYIQFQLEELSLLQLDKIDYEQLMSQLKTLENSELILQSTNEGIQLLDHEMGIIPQSKKLLQTLQRIAPFSEEIKNITDRIGSAEIELKDILVELEQYAASIDLNPKELDIIHEKLDKYQRTLAKHNKETQLELLGFWQELRNKNTLTHTLEESVAHAQKLLKEKNEKLLNDGQLLTVARTRAASKISNQLIPYFDRLKMSDASISFEIRATDKIDRNGCDQVELLFSTNKGIAPQVIEKAASGGELGRLMLILMTLLSEKKALPTVIFDEIDTGVSGDVAERIGQLLREMGQFRQLLTITHLPQVAACGHQHLSVRKTVLDEKMVSSVMALNALDRQQEIAQLLSGDTITEAALANANDLLNKYDTA